MDAPTVTVPDMPASAFSTAAGSVSNPNWATAYQQQAQPASSLAKGLNPNGQDFFYLNSLSSSGGGGGATGMVNQSKPIGTPQQPLFDANGQMVYNPQNTGYSLSTQAGTPAQNAPPIAKGVASNPFSTISNPKNPAITSAITSTLGDLTNLTNQNRQALASYTTNAAATQQANQAATTAQDSTLANIYNPNGLASQYNTLTNNFQNTSLAAGNLAMQNAAAQAAARGMSAGSTGAGSYYTQQLARENAAIAIPLAQQVAQQRIANLNQVLGLQSANLGRAQQLNTAQQQSLLLPIQANQQYVQGQNQNLAGIAQVDQANTFYGLQGPQTPQYQLPYQTSPVPTGGAPSGGYPRYSPQTGTFSSNGSPALNSAMAQVSQAPGGGPVQFSGPVNPAVAQAYQRITGKLPQMDPNFNMQAYQQALQQAGVGVSTPGQNYNAANPPSGFNIADANAGSADYAQGFMPSTSMNGPQYTPYSLSDATNPESQFYQGSDAGD